ncbi:MAG: alpha/beta fold hydrolase [Verrucomicrobiota bacterium]
MDFINVRNGKIAVEDVGSGPGLLFGHSYLWEASMWRPQVDFLANRYRCVVPELWAHGQSSAQPPKPCGLDELANDHWAVAQAKRMDRFVAVGLSVGGMWALRLALAHPEAVKALVLMDTSAGAEPPTSQARFMGLLDAVEQACAIPPPVAEAVAPFFFSNATLTNRPELVDSFKNTLIQIPAERIPGLVALGRGLFGRSCVLERLKEIRCPTLVLVGEDDVSRPVAEAREMAKRMPDAKLEIIPKAGHISNLEQPKQVNERINSFLTSVLPA